MENYDFISKIAEGSNSCVASDRPRWVTTFSIHTGAYGSVWRCIEKFTGRSVAVKKLKDVSAVGTEVNSVEREGYGARMKVIIKCSQCHRIMSSPFEKSNYFNN